MWTPYQILDLDPNVGTDEIRQRYLDLIRRHPPNHAPKRFERISKAYQAIASERARIATVVLGASRYPDFENGLGDLCNAMENEPRSPGLQQLIAVEGLRPDSGKAG